MRKRTLNKDKNGKLYFTISPPRAGKSTVASKWASEPGPRPKVVISGDKFRQALHAHAYIPEAEGMVFASMDVSIRALLLSGYDVMVDETSTTEGTIMRYLKIDPEATPVWVCTPIEICLERAIKTDKAYLIEPIKRIHDQMLDLRANWPQNFERMRAKARVRQNQDIHVKD